MWCLSSRISSKRSSSAVIQFIDSEESRKQLNQGKPLQKHCTHDGWRNGSVIHRYKFKLRVSRYLLKRIGDHPPTRKIKTEIEKPNLQTETLLEIFQKQNMHEREGTYFVIKQFDGTQKTTDWSMKYSYFTYASLPYSNMSMKPNTKSKLMKKGSRIWRNIWEKQHQNGTRQICWRMKNTTGKIGRWQFKKLLAIKVGLQYDTLITLNTFQVHSLNMP